MPKWLLIAGLWTPDNPLMLLKFKSRLSKVQGHLQILQILAMDSFLAFLLEFREHSSLKVVSLVMVGSMVANTGRWREDGLLSLPPLLTV